LTSKSTQKHVYFLVVDSTNINDQKFQQILHSLDKFTQETKSININTKILKNDLTNLNPSSVLSYTRNPGSPSIEQGLIQLKKSEKLDSNCSICVFLPIVKETDHKSLFNECLRVKTMGVDICIVYFDHNSKDFANSCSSSGRARLDSNDIYDILKDFFNLGKNVKDFQLALSVSAINYPIFLGEDLTLKLVFMNVGRMDIPKDVEVLFLEDTYFEKSFFVLPKITRSEKFVLVVNLPGKGNRDPMSIKEFIEIVVNHPKVDVSLSINYIKLFSDLFIKDFFHLAPPIKKYPFFNILCFGTAGSGKSSFINSLMTAFSDSKIEPAAVGGDTEHVTSALTRFRVSQIDGLKDVPINIFDVWGLDKNNYQNELLLTLLDGKLPNGYDMKDLVSLHLIDSNWEDISRQITSILFFMPYNVDDNPVALRALSNNFHLCRNKHRMIPLVVITRAELIGDKESQKYTLEQISKEFDIPEYAIYLHDNYTNQAEKVMEIDQRALTILKHTLELSSIYCYSQLCVYCGQKREEGFKACPYCGTDFYLSE